MTNYFVKSTKIFVKSGPFIVRDEQTESWGNVPFRSRPSKPVCLPVAPYPACPLLQSPDIVPQSSAHPLCLRYHSPQTCGEDPLKNLLHRMLGSFAP
jgi:hypothetical protein